MSFIDGDKLEKAVKELEARFTYVEREVLIRIMTQRMKDNLIKAKTQDVMGSAMKQSGSMMKKMLGMGDKDIV
jgi:hypothetical protein